MLSILIPTKDFNCVELITRLCKQAKELSVPFELLLAEDGSSEDNRLKNSIVSQNQNVRILNNAEAKGRATVRNQLSQEAKYENLIFIDSDAMVEKPDFIAIYINELQKCDVVCGGLYHLKERPSKIYSLRYKYEKKADKKRIAAIRKENPYDSFTTFNFAIKKTLFLSIGFDENFKTYGYEDTLFGYDLKKLKQPISHIDNPLLHTKLDKNAEYLKKIELSLKNLWKFGWQFEGNTPLLKTVKRLKQFKVLWLYNIFFKIFSPIIKFNLLSNHPCPVLLSAYKLGYYCRLNKIHGESL